MFHNKSPFHRAPLPVYHALGLSIGFWQILLEFNPVDIRNHGVDSWIPAVAAVEEQVLLVRRDSGAVFDKEGVNPMAKIARFGPGSIGQVQSQVQVSMPVTSRHILVCEYHERLVRSNTRIGRYDVVPENRHLSHARFLEIQTDMVGSRPSVVQKRDEPYNASSVSPLACGTEIEIAVCCKREGNFLVRRA